MSMPSVVVGTIGQCTVFQTPEYPGAYFKNSTEFWWPNVVDLSGDCGGFSGAVQAIMTVYVKNVSGSYNEKEIIIKGTASASGIGGLASALDNVSMPLTFSGSLLNCDSWSTSCTQAGAGSVVLNWANLAGDAVYDNKTGVLSFWEPWSCSGTSCSFTFDPLALDGAAKSGCTSCSSTTVSLTTSSSDDVIVVLMAFNVGGADVHTDFQVTDTSSLTWTNREAAYLTSGDSLMFNEQWAISSGVLSSDTITCENTGGQIGTLSCIAFGVSDANTGSPFDSNSAVPTLDSSTSSSVPTSSISTSNADDFIIGLAAIPSNDFHSPSGWSLIDEELPSGGNAGAYAEYMIVSSTQSGLAVKAVATQSYWFMEADAIVQASSSTVTQPINVGRESSFGGSNQVITIGGSCSPSPSTFTGDNTTHDVTMDASCSYTLSVPSHYAFSGSSGGTTCSSGTCSTATFVYYYELVSQGIQITTLPANVSSADFATIDISGCGVSNSSLKADGFIHTYSSLTATCSVTLTLAVGFSNYNPSGYAFNGSPHPNPVNSSSFNTCGRGTCTTYSNDTYYEIGLNESVTPESPTVWDGYYNWGPSSTFLGQHMVNACSNLTTEGSGISYCYGYEGGYDFWDYGVSVTFEEIGNTWSPQIPNTLHAITPGESFNVNYIQSSTGPSVSSGPGVTLWLLALPFLTLGFVVAYKRRIIRFR